MIKRLPEGSLVLLSGNMTMEMNSWEGLNMSDIKLGDICIVITLESPRNSLIIAFPRSNQVFGFKIERDILKEYQKELEARNLEINQTK